MVHRTPLFDVSFAGLSLFFFSFRSRNVCLLRGVANMSIEHIDDETYSPSGQFLPGRYIVLRFSSTMTVQVPGAGTLAEPATLVYGHKYHEYTQVGIDAPCYPYCICSDISVMVTTNPKTPPTGSPKHSLLLL